MLVASTILLLLLSTPTTAQSPFNSQQSKCGKQDTSKVLTCGIKWSLTVSAITRGKSSGLRVMQGVGRTGTLAEALTTGDTALHIKAGPGATFSTNDDLLVESPGGSSGENFTFGE